jgi:hypothetical protein
MDFAPEEPCHIKIHYELEIFDVRIPGTAERFHRARLAWGESAEVEMLDLDHPVLVIRPGGARRCK